MGPLLTSKDLSESPEINSEKLGKNYGNVAEPIFFEMSTNTFHSLEKP